MSVIVDMQLIQLSSIVNIRSICVLVAQPKALWIWSMSWVLAIHTEAQTIRLNYGSGMEGFPLLSEDITPSIWVDAEDADVVILAAEMLQRDLGTMGNRSVEIFHGGDRPRGYTILIGTLAHNEMIRELVDRGELKVDGLHDKWEASLLTMIQDPFPGMASALVITGSDRRGVAYGVMELLKQLGVSPWTFWADVPIPRRQQVYFEDQYLFIPPPAVQYRGIFLNDELWGLQQWAIQRQDTAYKGLGPETYEKIFDLMLRLKANYLWPARHSAFNDHPENAALADAYAIVRGGAHNSPLLGNARKEWDEQKQGPWNYEENAPAMRAFWRNNLQQFGHYENVYTVGLRGVGDLGMKGGENVEEKIALLERIIQEQREMLQQALGTSPHNIPQIFVAYKEVLKLYEKGLELPDDVTIVWPDDNYGYLKRLPDFSERKRSGGAGVYYHFSYLGRPHDYLWLCTTPPMLIFEELKKAWEFGARKVWVFNVGDIKPAEYAWEFAQDLAWHADSMSVREAYQHLEKWYQGLFGEETGKAITSIKQAYYHLAFSRKPEHMGWSRIEPRSPVVDTEWSFIHYGEAERRLQRYHQLQEQVTTLWVQIPDSLKPAFYQMVYYPVMASALMNQKILWSQQNRWYAQQGRISALALADSVKACHARILSITKAYEQLEGGKWKGMGVYADLPFEVYQLPPLDTSISIQDKQWNIWIAGMQQTGEGTLPTYFAFADQAHFFDLYNSGHSLLSWKVSASHPWIKLSQHEGILDKQERIEVAIDWKSVPPSPEWQEGRVEVEVDGHIKTVEILLDNRGVSAELKGTFMEIDGVVAIPAERYHKAKEEAAFTWKRLEGLGHTGKVVTATPITAKGIDYEWDVEQNAPSLEYDFYTFSSGWFEILTFVLPTHPIHSFRGAKFAISVDDMPPLIVDFSTKDRSEAWKENVARNAAIGRTQHFIEDPGNHTLKFWLLDTGVHVDRFLLDFGGLRASYLGPMTTQRK